MSTTEFRYREDARWPCSMGASIETPAGIAAAQCVNLSSSGALLQANLQPRVAVGERLKIHLEDAEMPVVATAEVVRVTPNGLAVRFVDLRADVEHLLRHVLDQRIAAARAKRPRRAQLVPAYT